MPKFLFVALVVFPCLAFAQAPADAPSPQPTGILEATGANAPRLVEHGPLTQHVAGTDVPTAAPHDPYARTRRSLVMFLGGAGAIAAGGLAGGGLTLLGCQRDYCGVTAIIVGLTAGAVALPLGVWLTGTFLADGDGSLLASYVGAVLGLAVTLPLHAIPNLGSGASTTIVALNAVAPLLGAVLFYEATSHESASAARALQVTGVGLIPSAIQDSTGELLPVIALSGRFH